MVVKRQTDTSIISLIGANLFVLGLALVGQVHLVDLLWIFWIQSVLIGFFNVFKILDLKEFSTKGFKINGRPATPTRKTQVTTAVFFAVHFGIFHFAYLLFILHIEGTPSLPWIASSFALFFSNHLYSYITNRARDRKKKRNIGHVMFLPYARIIPMHFIIFIMTSTTTALSLVWFLALKTSADLAMHVVEHKV